MGGAVSSGCDNDDLINNLLDAEYIRTSVVERAFRAVDRADYFLASSRSSAYKDLAWKSGNLHISAPCIYSKVMETLCLKPGLSFLNLGSGTGYLSTMVGLILGNYGINHGVEMHKDVIEYAIKKLEDFKKYSGAIDEYDFCEPKFTQGNCLCLTRNQQYDRVYCGAGCPEIFSSYMKNLLRVNGILVMPINDQLLQIKRTSVVDWEVNVILPVSFSTLIIPAEGKEDSVELFDIEPQTLQSLCRSNIRNILRSVIKSENPNLKTYTSGTKLKNGTRSRNDLILPCFEDSDGVSDDERTSFCVNSRPVSRFVVRNRRGNRNDHVNDILGIVMDHLVYRRRTVEQSNEQNNVDNDSNNENAQEENNDPRELDFFQIISESDSDIEPVPEPNPQAQEEGNNFDPNVALSSMNEIQEVMVDVLHELERELTEEERNLNTEHAQALPDRSSQEENNSASGSTSQSRPRHSTCEKIDSGLGEDIIEKDVISISPLSSDHEHMELDSSSSSNDGQNRRNKRLSRQANLRSWKCRRVRAGVRRLYSISSTDSDDMEDDLESNEPRVVLSPYTAHMQNKIQQLPLPPILKNYLNYFRDF